MRNSLVKIVSYSTLMFFPTIIFLVILELVFRLLLFSEVNFMASLKHPDQYANNISCDYFKLQHYFGEKCGPASDDHLGWVNSRLISNKEYRHRDTYLIGHRRPVLLYGDSFAQCLTPPGECFQDILNVDERFQKDFFLINYGVEGYGLDQILLLYKKTIPIYSNPIVIISLLDRDLERSMCGSTWGLKPYFSIEEGQLKYHGEHLGLTVEDYFQKSPPEILSYLYALMINGKFVPETLKSLLTNFDQQKLKLEELNKKIILEIVSDLTKRNLTYIFLIFEHTKTIVEPMAWRVIFLTNLLRENDVPFMLTRDVIIGYENDASFDWRKYSLSSKSTHPNFFYNKLISEAILDWVLKTNAPFENYPEH